MKHSHQVVVDNVGQVYSGLSQKQADKVFREYAIQSSRGSGRSGNERVTWLKDGSIHREFEPVTVLAATPTNAFYFVLELDYDKYAEKLRESNDIRLYNVEIKMDPNKIGVIMGGKSIQEAELALFDILHYQRISKAPRPVIS